MSAYQDIQNEINALSELINFLCPNDRESDIDFLEENIETGVSILEKLSSLNIFSHLEAIYFEQGDDKVKKLIERIKLSHVFQLSRFKRYYNKGTFKKSKNQLFLYKTAELKRLINFCDIHVRGTILEIRNFENHYFDAKIDITSKTKKSQRGTSPTDRLIIFESQESYKKTFKLLKDFFKNQDDLKKVLNGYRLHRPLIFPQNQNKLVELFRRLQYNGHLMPSNTEVKEWLCQNFAFQSNRLNTIVRPFNPSTVWDILSKGKGEPPRSSRICDVEWLPYLNPYQVRTASIKERL